MSVYQLSNQVMNYAWGSTTAIPQLLGRTPDQQQPWAEMWMGAHSKAPSSIVIDNRWEPLNEWIELHRRQALGVAAAARFGELPFLLKVLAVAQPLSLQVHPNAEQAAEGFSRENSLGIPPGSPIRNYKDPNPKQELLCALEPFQVMIGFRPLTETRRLLERFGLLNEFKLLAGDTSVNPGSFKKFFARLLRADDEHLAWWIGEALAQAPQCPERNLVEKLESHYHADPGVLAPLFLNVQTLQPGEAVFLTAGVPHTYIEGMGIEVMRCSDNVLRGGLTPKHRDIDELLKTIDWRFEQPSKTPAVSVSKCEKRYPAPVESFQLSHVQLEGEALVRQVTSAQIVLVIEGRCTLRWGDDKLELTRGESAFICATTEQVSLEGRASLYCAQAPE
ncbi:MAG: mannose-6-phosphate isomerase, class I [Candidatus Cloacimonetes bacterium]|nr:mannose-6-phosphate isomerase, class I [Candidatus Cloacimonadota bacterium]